MKPVTLKNQIAVISGGLGGIGRAVAQKLKSAGATVVLADRQKLEHAKPKAIFFSADVTDPKKVKQVITAVYKKFKRLDILVNCAGIIGPIGQTHTTEQKLWEDTIKVNLFGTVNLCHAALPFMLKAKKGKIINLAGGGAVEPFPNFSAYASSKAAVVRFTENLAKEYETKNIQVNAVSPGRINTALLDNLIKAGPKKVGKEYYKKFLADKNRGADSIDTATDLVLFLADPKNKLTGKLISAQWDKWKGFRSKQIKELNESPNFSLRRIDNKYFYEK